MTSKVSIGNHMIDISDPEIEVEVILLDGRLWVNVDGVCRLRVSNIEPEKLSVDYSPENWTTNP